MTYKGLMQRLSVCGVVLMLTTALLNTSCSSYRQVEESTRQEKRIETESLTALESQAEQEQEETREETTEAVTVTEIEIFDTDKAPDPATGTPPLKARITQHTDRTGTSRIVERTHATEKTEVTENEVYSGGELAEAVVVAQKPPSLWERMKKGVMWGVAAIILAAAVWLFLKLKR